MGILQMIREKKNKITSNFERRAEAKTFNRIEKLDRIRQDNERLQVRADIKQSLAEEERKNKELKYSGVKKLFGGIAQGIKSAQSNRKKTGVLFGKGSKKPINQDRFSNKGVFYNK